MTKPRSPGWYPPAGRFFYPNHFVEIFSNRSIVAARPPRHKEDGSVDENQAVLDISEDEDLTEDGAGACAAGEVGYLEMSEAIRQESRFEVDDIQQAYVVGAASAFSEGWVYYRVPRAQYLVTFVRQKSEKWAPPPPK